MKSNPLAGPISFAHLAGLSVRADDEDKEYQDNGDDQKSKKSKRAKKAEDDDDDPRADDEDNNSDSAENDRPADDVDEDEDDRKSKKSKRAKKAESGDDDEAEDDPNPDSDKDNAKKAFRRGVASERARFTKVLGSKAAARNLPVAARLLTATSMNAADIVASLADLPRAGASVPGRTNPNLGPNGTPGAGSASALAASWDSAFAKAKGTTSRPR
jgi:hypothetical protein